MNARPLKWVPTRVLEWTLRRSRLRAMWSDAWFELWFRELEEDDSGLCPPRGMF